MAHKKRTFLVEMNDGTRMRVTCPETARVTFGPVSPKGFAEPALRIYEGANKENQYAIFVGVQSFLDEANVSVQYPKITDESKSKHHDRNTESSRKRDVEF